MLRLSFTGFSSLPGAKPGAIHQPFIRPAALSVHTMNSVKRTLLVVGILTPRWRRPLVLEQQARSASPAKAGGPVPVIVKGAKRGMPVLLNVVGRAEAYEG